MPLRSSSWSWPVITIQPHRIPRGSHANMPTKLTKIQFGSPQSPPKSEYVKVPPTVLAVAWARLGAQMLPVLARSQP